MSKWWESERSLIAARVRSTRRRMRAGFRGALREAVKRAAWKANEKVREAIREWEIERDRAADAAAKLARISATGTSFGWSHRLVVEVELDDAILVRADHRAVLDEIGRVVARSVERKWSNTDFSAIESGRVVRPSPTNVKL